MARPLRIVGYAINGRGMGHLVRQLSILRTAQRLCALVDVRAECWILTSSEADTLARREGIPAIKLPSKAMLRDAGLEPHHHLAVLRGLVLQAIATLQPDVLVVDTFPGGSVGELVSVLELVPHRILVQRAVREDIAATDAYQALLPLYDRVIVPDDRGTGPILIRERTELMSRDAARAALGIPDDRRTVYLSLGGGGDLAAPGALPRLTRTLRDGGWHVVVGAGPLYQGEEVRGEGITWLSRYVPIELLPGVDAAVSAAGYNSFHELMHVGVPTVFLPQPRISDDQEGRAARAEAAGAGRVARSVDDVLALLDSPGTAAAARALVPHNGARAAAAEVLRDVLPAEDLAVAVKALTPELQAGLRRLVPEGAPAGAALDHAMALVRVLAGGSPSTRARRRALLAELAEQGIDVPPPEPDAPADLLGRFLALCDQHAVPIDTALALLRALDRKFPAAGPRDLIAACTQLFPAWARFSDWMGAISLLRAMPTQRNLTLSAFTTAMVAWLAREDDLFDALRDFSRLEARGQRSVAEVLRLLSQEPS
ncbi:MAG: hypothetical protein H6742_22080 [Alphaproteobacteria bacterium]|nr:hypothetical protein [Alphaproteobacteria bacterium]